MHAPGAHAQSQRPKPEPTVNYLCVYAQWLYPVDMHNPAALVCRSPPAWAGYGCGRVNQRLMVQRIDRAITLSRRYIHTGDLV